ncbi:hypothetical protein BT96DRAFT_950223 [Gymnopus androsaceus JB14]|uniref:Uncharacterized protein n=1 Tax=Gymnopus androsaceus JB14 TaxID=1447944 RepID=A0A6A4GHC6_9AGAR|nr:hypothetical protein BT96DRAFT_950223 [Gymnopus androsaceus JB14]
MANNQTKKNKRSGTSSGSGASAGTSKRRRTQPELSGAEDNPMDVDGDTDLELTMPTPTPKSTKSFTLSERAQQFKAGFKDGATDDEILVLLLEKQMKGWTSSVYDHFVSPLTINASDPVAVKYTFHCKIYTNQIVTRLRHNDSTSNLKHHIARCSAVPNAEATGQLTMPMFAGGSTYSDSKLRLYIVEWCACNNRPMMIVEDKVMVEGVQLKDHIAWFEPGGAYFDQWIQNDWDWQLVDFCFSTSSSDKHNCDKLRTVKVEREDDAPAFMEARISGMIDVSIFHT